MNHLVMMIKDDDNEIISEEGRKWCLISSSAGSNVTLCTGEVFEPGEGVAEGISKTVTRGGITCKICLDIIRRIKAVRL